MTCTSRIGTRRVPPQTPHISSNPGARRHCKYHACRLPTSFTDTATANTAANTLLTTKAFCVEDAINNAILDAIESAELTALEGDDRKAEVVEVSRMRRGRRYTCHFFFVAIGRHL